MDKEELLANINNDDNNSSGEESNDEAMNVDLDEEIAVAEDAD